MLNGRRPAVSICFRFFGSGWPQFFMTNLIYLSTLLVTNWVATGDSKRENGTNYVQLRAVITQQTLIEEVSLCTNRTIYKVQPAITNGRKWQIGSPPYLPPLPL